VDTGYVLDIYWSRPHVRMVGRLENGETFECRCSYSRSQFFVREGMVDRLPLGEKTDVLTTDLITMDGESVRRILPESDGVRQAMLDSGVSTYEADLSTSMKFQIDMGLGRKIKIGGEWLCGNHVDRAYLNPITQADDVDERVPNLHAMSMDIETSARGEVIAVSLCGYWLGQKRYSEQILTVGPEKSVGAVTYFADECALLQGFKERIGLADPDLLIGWNIADFDMRVLRDRFEHRGVPFALGRTKQKSWIPEGRRWGGNAVVVQGRQVVDLMHVIRRRPERYEDYRLDTVARKLIGRGKLVDANIEELERLRLENKSQFLDYCLEDARLVREIAEREDVLNLAVRKSILTGLPISRADGSIAAFDLMYGQGLRKRGVVAPTLGVDRLGRGGAPGGMVLSSRPGIYENVWVFDFKSLYPSIMMTLNIDPLAYTMALKGDVPYLEAPNGARFARALGILPEILEKLWDSRERAKSAGDAVGAFSYKITMNSFYGVLASGDCRFANSQIAGAITKFGHEVLEWTKSLIESIDGKNQHEVLYGDTDSLFVISRFKGDKDAVVLEMGRSLCEWVNNKLQEYVSETYAVECRMELEFSKAYRKFYLPYHRGSDRGRAKGYAGTIIGVSEEPEVVGMEAVRRDWTDLSHNLQRKLLKLIFQDRPVGDIEEMIWDEVCAIRGGERDGELVYRKRLRKEINAYAKVRPPHVRAASISGAKKGDLIRYIMTINGPEPLGTVKSAIDYGHYVEKQVAPIVESVARVFPIDSRSALFGERRLLF